MTTDPVAFVGMWGSCAFLCAILTGDRPDTPAWLLARFPLDGETFGTDVAHCVGPKPRNSPGDSFGRQDATVTAAPSVAQSTLLSGGTSVQPRWGLYLSSSARCSAMLSWCRVSFVKGLLQS